MSGANVSPIGRNKERWSPSSQCVSDHPGRSNKEASRHLVDLAATTPHEEGTTPDCIVILHPRSQVCVTGSLVRRGGRAIKKWSHSFKRRGRGGRFRAMLRNAFL